MLKTINIENVYKDKDDICLVISNSELLSYEKKIDFLNNDLEIKEIHTDIGGIKNNVER